VRPLPELVGRATALANARGFAHSCTPGTGRLLATLGAASTGPVYESGTGYGVGTAWLHSGLPAGRPLVTVDHDAERVAAVRALFGPTVEVLLDDWAVLRAYPRCGLFFVDGGGKAGGPDAVADLVRPGGVVVLDEFTPCDTWPPMYAGQPDTLRIAWLTDARFVAVELRTEPDHAVLVATRRR
jgi:predicted O-methyltransferase YrrM